MTKTLSIDVNPSQLKQLLDFINGLKKKAPDMPSPLVTVAEKSDSPRILEAVESILSQKKRVRNQSEEEMMQEILKSREEETYSTEEAMRIVQLCTKRRFAGESTPLKA